jgi:serine/threonine-protein kinase ATR
MPFFLFFWPEPNCLFHQDREPSRRNQVKSSTDLASLARNALLPIEKKLKGIYATSKEKEKQQKEISTSNLVQMLIQEATDDANLVRDVSSQVHSYAHLTLQAKMYPGWASWH